MRLAAAALDRVAAELALCEPPRELDRCDWEGVARLEAPPERVAASYENAVQWVSELEQIVTDAG